MSAQLINKALIVNHSTKTQTVKINNENVESPPLLVVSVIVSCLIMNKHLDVMAKNNIIFDTQGMATQISINDANIKQEAYIVTYTIPPDKIPDINPPDVSNNESYLLYQKIGIGVSVAVIGTSLGYAVKRYVQKPLVNSINANRNLLEIETERLELERRAKVIDDMKNGVEKNEDINNLNLNKNLVKVKPEESLIEESLIKKQIIKTPKEIKNTEKANKEFKDLNERYKDLEDPQRHIKKAKRIKDENARKIISDKEQIDYEKSLKLIEEKNKKLADTLSKANKKQLEDLAKANKKQLEINAKNAKAELEKKPKFTNRAEWDKEQATAEVKQINTGINNNADWQKDLAKQRKSKFVNKDNMINKDTDEFLKRKKGTYTSKLESNTDANGIKTVKHETRFTDKLGEEINPKDVEVSGKKLAKNSKGEWVDSKGNYLNEKSLVSSKGKVLAHENDNLNNSDFIGNSKPELIKGKNVYQTPEGIVDNKGNYLDENGEILDNYGRLLNTEYKLTNSNGNIVNHEGNLVENLKIKFDGLPKFTKASSKRTVKIKQDIKQIKAKQEKKYQINENSSDSDAGYNSFDELKQKRFLEDVKVAEQKEVNKEVNIIQNDKQISDQFLSCDNSNEEINVKPNLNTEQTVTNLDGNNIGASNFGKKASEKDINSKVKNDSLEANGNKVVVESEEDNLAEKLLLQNLEKDTLNGVQDL